MAERLNVNPNRMELIKLRRRLQIARRGHKLLKDKFDEMMKLFLALVREMSELRVQVEKEIAGAQEIFALARSETSTQELEEALSFPESEVSVRVDKVNLMSVRVPEFDFEIDGAIDCYGLAATPTTIDESLRLFRALLPHMVELSQKEKAVLSLADEIEKTRRRVNALEYVLIPQLEQTIRYITMKLDEFERANLTKLMKIKELVEQSA